MRGSSAWRMWDGAARRVLTLIDGLGAQKVIRDAADDEIMHIAHSFAATELGYQPSVSTRSSAAT